MLLEFLHQYQNETDTDQITWSCTILVLLQSLSLYLGYEDLQIILDGDLINTLANLINRINPIKLSLHSRNIAILPQTPSSMITKNWLRLLTSISGLRLFQIICLNTCLISKPLSKIAIDSIGELLWQLLSKLKKYRRSLLGTDWNLSAFLIFLRRLSFSTNFIATVSSIKWIKSLLEINKTQSENNNDTVINIQQRLLAINLLKRILSTFTADEHILRQIVESIFDFISDMMSFIQPLEEYTDFSALLVEYTGDLSTKLDLSIPIKAAFDPDLSICCTVEGSTTLVHGVNGRGYGVVNASVKSGNRRWNFYITQDTRNCEGICIGMTRYPISDYNYRTTSDMWLYRAHNGNLYHSGELPSSNLPPYAAGDYITVIVDMQTCSIAFSKNDEEPIIAFENVNRQELFPVVIFGNNSPGEKICLLDMKIEGPPIDLVAGDPLCAPSHVISTQAFIELISELHEIPNWNKVINEIIVKRLTIRDNVMVSNPDETDTDMYSHIYPHHQISDCGPNRSVYNVETLEEHHNSKYPTVCIHTLCRLAWPALAILGGIDCGFRVGCLCQHLPSSRMVTLLGMKPRYSKLVKVLWNDTDAAVRLEINT